MNDGAVVWYFKRYIYLSFLKKFRIFKETYIKPNFYKLSFILFFCKIFPINSIQIEKQNLTFFINKKDLLLIFFYLRFSSKFYLSDIFGCDYLSYFNERFCLIYNFINYKFKKRIFFKIFLKEYESVLSTMSIFPSSNWLEREIFDLYGVWFSNHSDLRRILTDYGFNGYPLQKNFPLSGYVEVSFDDNLKRVIYKPLVLSQEFRDFEFMSPWEWKE